MIANIDDISTALDSIRTENESYPDAMEDRMDSVAFNESFRRIEAQLNQLYEKIRLIEDVDSFCLDYVTKEIKKKEDAFRENLKILESVSDLYKDSKSISIMVPFSQTSDAVRDRDGSTISRMSLKNGKLEAGNDVLGSALIATIARSSDTPCYNNSYSNLLNGKPGTSYYSIKTLSPGSIEEHVFVTLREPTECNYISIKPVNCEVNNIILIDESQVSHQMSVTSGYIQPVKISAVSFTLVAKQFVKDKKAASVRSYDCSGVFGMTDNAFMRWQNEQLVKGMELSRQKMEEKYIINQLETACDICNSINEGIRRRNIIASGKG